MQKLGKKIAAFMAAVAMLVATGCSAKDTSWVYKSKDITVPAGVYLLNLIDEYNNAKLQLQEQNAEKENDDADYTKVKEVLKLKLNDTAVSDVITENTKNAIKKFIVINQKFDEYGLELEESDIAAIKNTTDITWEESSKYYEANGVSETSLRKYYEAQKKQEKLFYHLYDVGGEFGMTEEELKEAFYKDYAKANYMMFAKKYDLGIEEEKTDEKSIEEQNAEIKKTAEEYLERLKKGEAIEDLIFDWDKKNAEDASTVVKPEKGSRSLLVNSESAAYFGEDINNAVLNGKIGTPFIHEDDVAFYIFEPVDLKTAETNDFEEQRSNVLLSLNYDKFEELIAEWSGNAEAEVNEDAVARYTPDKIKLRSDIK